MKYTLQRGKVTVSLTQKYYKGAGGEGEIYARDGIVYKISNNGKIILPEGKFDELSLLTNPRIIVPQDLLLENGKLVGYTMKYIERALPLGATFTNAWRNKHTNFTNNTLIQLLKQWAADLDYVHSKNCLVVDVNELNFLLDENFGNVYFIDVNSWQTKNYPATAIMDNIRNRACNNHFTYLTDWYSWGILAFNWLVGIHPFKGWHENYNSLDKRMKNNHSILKGDVNYPKNAVRPLKVVPEALMNWFKLVFDDGKLCKPPLDFESKLGSFHIISKDYSDSINLKVEKTDVQLDSYDYNQGAIQAYVQVVSGKLQWRLKNESVWRETIIGAARYMSYMGRLFLINDYGENLFELRIDKVGTNYLSTIKVICPILASSTKLFDGVAIQRLYKSVYCTVFPDYTKFAQYQIKSLEDYREVVSAKYKKNFLIVVAMRHSGQYDRIIYHVNNKCVELYKTCDVDLSSISFCVLDKGLCIYLKREGELGLISKDKDKHSIIHDDMIEENWNLESVGDKVYFTPDFGQNYFKISM